MPNRDTRADLEARNAALPTKYRVTDLQNYTKDALRAVVRKAEAEIAAAPKAEEVKETKQTPPTPRVVQDAQTRAEGKRKSKTKFTCPDCNANAWAKPAANLVCGDCSEVMEVA